MKQPPIIDPYDLEYGDTPLVLEPQHEFFHRLTGMPPDEQKIEVDKRDEIKRRLLMTPKEPPKVIPYVIMPHGGRREGAGRKKGRPSKKNLVTCTLHIAVAKEDLEAWNIAKGNTMYGSMTGKCSSVDLFKHAVNLVYDYFKHCSTHGHPKSYDDFNKGRGLPLNLTNNSRHILSNPDRNG